MGISAYIYAAIFAVGMAIGGGAAYKITYSIQHAQVVKMELAIANQKIEAAQTLAVETQKVADATNTQVKLNLEKDKLHEELIQNKNDSVVKLNNFIASMRSQPVSGKSGIDSSVPGSNTTINSTNETEFVIVSRKLLTYLGAESARAQVDGIDKNELLKFVMVDNCGIPK
ncbi:hypothetical protein M0R04_07750 [Candidatus Dojkabacteria bacterium]|jgi:esterase/lipase|nr:hypothetical protein [Candidatus Dojkabacteria bacterium]